MILIILGIPFLLFLGRWMSLFMGIEVFDIIHYVRPPMSDEEIDRLIQPLGPKGYTYPEPSEEAKNRVVDCSQLYSMYEFPRTNPLCLNIYQTTPEQITQKVADGQYDRIVFYAERSVFDVPVSAQGEKNYISDVYQTVKFMDSIALPKFLKAYGLTDVSYVKDTKPYPYLFYRISSLDDSDKVCHYGNSSEKVRGCARSYYVSIIPLSAVGPQLSNARPILRQTDKKRFSYLSHYPSDCFTNDTFAHETSHLLSKAVESESRIPSVDPWFSEQVAGFFGIYGDDLACGDGTITMQRKPEIKDAAKALVEFNSTFAPADLSHEYPVDNICRQAMLTEWYAFLSKGNYRDNFQRFFKEMRATTPSLIDDTVFAKFLLRLDPDPAAKDLLISKGCKL